MAMENEKIKMKKYRNEGSRIYSGRPLGESVRIELGLNEKDKDSATYFFYFPKDTMSINSSYFGGLFEESVICLGREQFKEKYIFLFEDGEELSDILKFNIEEGIGDALREY